MFEKIVTLRTGEDLTIRVVEPPLTEYSERSPDSGLVNWLWTEIKQEVISGAMKPWLYTPYAIGEIDGELVGSLAYYTATYNQEVGLIQFVETAEHHRSKGIASALISTLVDKFDSEGGLALMLCTSNPIAGSLYEKHGFWYSIGDGLRYLAPGSENYDETFFAHNGKAEVREATWADLPYISALYNHPEPTWLIKDSLTGMFRDMRYESHFVKMMRRVGEGNGGYFVLHNPKNRIVGVAVFERIDSYQEQHVANLSFRVVPSYFDQTKELIDRVASIATELSVGILQVCIGARDQDQMQLAYQSGFTEEAKLAGRLRDGSAIVDMLILTKTLATDVKPLRCVGDYYGGRKPWMLERIASRTGK